MGWSDCGKDSKGRRIGYLFEAECDHPDCDKKIHRGLDYACGGMHGETTYGCERYFCYEHLMIVDKNYGGQLCDECYKILVNNTGDWNTED